MAQEMKSLTDEELMTRYQQGDEFAFEELYQRHSSKVYGYLAQRLKERSTVDDVFQAAFLKLHRSRGQYNPSFPFLPWLFTICRTVMIDAVRKRENSIEELHSECVEQAHAKVANSQTNISLPDLGVLSEPQRQAVTLRFAHDYSFEDISRRLETSPANVRQLLSRAIKKLRKNR